MRAPNGMSLCQLRKCVHNFFLSQVRSDLFLILQQHSWPWPSHFFQNKYLNERFIDLIKMLHPTPLKNELKYHRKCIFSQSGKPILKKFPGKYFPGLP